MIQSHAARPAPRRRPVPGLRAVVLVLAAAAVATALGARLPAGTSPTAVLDRGEHRSGSGAGAASGAAGGAVPPGTTVFDDAVPGVARLDPALLGALRRAAGDAAVAGVVFRVDSGWRSPAYQARLRREAVAKYGSEAEAARWVATPETSAHVSGDAVDIGRSDAAAWLSAHGAGYGLCRVYANEPWHFELRPDAPDRGCPPMYPDAAHDPRLR